MNEQEWLEFFGKIFAQVKKRLTEHYGLEEDGSGPPDIVALRKSVDSLPFAIKIVEVRINTAKYQNITDKDSQLMMYDFSRLGNLIVEYCGSIDVDDKSKLAEILTSDFGLKESDVKGFIRGFYPELNTLAWLDPERYPDSYIVFTQGDIRKNPNEFAFQLATDFSMFFGDMIARKFKMDVDYTAQYSLKPDSILSTEELLKRDSTYPNMTVEDLQKMVSGIQLIPSVPEAVQRIFRNAKELYIFGYFRYNFFTISQHYAHLALESAIKNKYAQSWGEEMVLRNKRGKEVKMRNTGYEDIISYCYTHRGWNPHGMSINGKKFAYTKEELGQWLVEQGLITKWEKRLCLRGLELRNLLSHQTRAPIHLPGHAHSSLVEMANLINRLYAQK